MISNVFLLLKIITSQVFHKSWEAKFISIRLEMILLLCLEVAGSRSEKAERWKNRILCLLALYSCLYFKPSVH